MVKLLKQSNLIPASNKEGMKMIRKELENKGIKMTDDEFSEVMAETTTDIKENRLRLGVKSNKSYLIRTAIIYYQILKRIEV
jgi:hypothetical protein